MKTGKEREYQRIGIKIREARQAAKMSQKELASKIGYESATAISLIETGERRISVADLEQLTKTLCRDIKFFLNNNHNVKNNIQYALRANKELSKADQEEILRFIEFVKMKNDKHSK